MNREEAKYILRSYPPGGCDAEDPQFREALEMLKQDPELASWFEQEQAIDANLSRKFTSFPVPPSLKGQLLAARKVVPLRVWWQRPAWIIAAAACVTLIAALALFLIRAPGQRQFAEFQSYVADTAARLDHLDIQTSDLAQIRQWLGDHRAPESFVVPAGLNGKSTVGCRVFEWNGQKVSLVCFNLEDKKIAHVFIIDRSALANPPVGHSPQFQSTADGIATASWSDDRRTYIVAMQRGEEDLKRLFL
jgi:hypothetical protein